MHAGIHAQKRIFMASARRLGNEIFRPGPMFIYLWPYVTFMMHICKQRMRLREEFDASDLGGSCDSLIPKVEAESVVYCL